MAERILLNKGTVEHLVVDVTDRLTNLLTLVGTNAMYDYRKRGVDSYIVENQPAIVEGMMAFCLVDTTTLDYGVYLMYVHFENLPEVPRLGPFEFEVNA